MDSHTRRERALAPRRAPHLLVLLVPVLLLLLLPAALEAQEESSLRKSDIVRLLAEPRPAAEIAGVVSRRCLSFRPTDRDLRDFRAMGAGDAVMEAIETCSFDGAGPSAASSDDEPGSELTLFIDPRRVRAPPGEVVRVRAEVSAGADPVADVPLQLREASGGEGTLVSEAVTEGDGGAVLDLTVPEGEGTRRFILLSPERNLQGANLVEIEVTAAPASEAGEDAEMEGTGNEVAGEPGGDPEDGTGDDAGARPGNEIPGEGAEAAAGLASLLERADRLSRSGQYGRAADLYERALAEEPDRVETLLGYGLHLARTGAHEEAERRVQRARRIAPERADVRRTLGMLALWRGEPRQATVWLRSALEASPEDAEAWAALGRALAETGRQAEAREALRRAEALRGG